MSQCPITTGTGVQVYSSVATKAWLEKSRTLTCPDTFQFPGWGETILTDTVKGTLNCPMFLMTGSRPFPHNTCGCIASEQPVEVPGVQEVIQELGSVRQGPGFL